jgi:intracellular sulfur oxidation DsrE/DsrF family protein
MSQNPRRRFVAQLGAAAAALTGGSVLVRAQAPSHQHPPQSPRQHRHDSPHDAWMRQLTGHHRQFFHALAPTDTAGLMAKNFLDAYTGPYGMRAEHVNAVIGVHGPGLGIVFSDAIWQKFELGRRWNVNDPATGQHSVRNFLATQNATSVAELQKRGVVFLVCDTALQLAGALWAPSVTQTPEATHAEFLANLLAGVIPVPAMVVAINRAQEAGFTYVRAS